MKLLLLKTLLRRKKDEGFTLPIVIAIGMVMVLLSAVDLVQSGEENLNAISQEGSADALAAAELGVSRYRDFLLSNRVLAVNDLGSWTGLDNETCNAISATGNGWANTNNWRPINLDEDASSADLNSDGDTNDTFTIGSYRIVNYQYGRANGDNSFSQLSDDNDPDDDPVTPVIPFDFSTNNHNDTNDDGDSDAIGVLTIEGKDTPPNTDGSVSRLQVTIPIGVNTQDLDDLDPAIWIQQGEITNFGNVNVNGSNIVLYRPTEAGVGRCGDPTDYTTGGTPQSTISDPRNLPSFTRLTNLLSSLNSTEKNTLYEPINDAQNNSYIVGSNQILIGRPTHNEHSDERYYFEVTTGLDLNNNYRITTDGEAKVILYINGDLEIDGNVDIVNTSGDATSQYLEIHVDGDVIITGSGTVNINGLIRATGKVDIGGSVDVNITGSVFANDWDNTSSGTVSITTDDYRFYSITPNRTPAPLTFRPSGWETQEAN